MFQEEGVEKFKTHISYSVTFFFNLALFEIMWKKYSRPREITNNNMAHANFMLGT